MTKKPAIHCAYDKLVPLDELTPHPRNPNEHPQKQVELLAAIIRKTGWRSPIVISKRSGYIVSGHGRYQAAIAGGFTSAPVNFQDFDSDESEIAHLVADNKIASLAEINSDALGKLLHDYQGIDPTMIAYDSKALDTLLKVNPAQELAKVIQNSREWQQATDGAARAATKIHARLDALVAKHPDAMTTAQAIIISAGTNKALIITDPTLGDFLDELERYAAAGEASPLARILESVHPL